MLTGKDRTGIYNGAICRGRNGLVYVPCGAIAVICSTDSGQRLQKLMADSTEFSCSVMAGQIVLSEN